MSNSNPFTKEEVDLLNEYIKLTIVDFREFVDSHNEDDENYNRLGTLHQRIATLSDKLNVLLSDSY